MQLSAESLQLGSTAGALRQNLTVHHSRAQEETERPCLEFCGKHPLLSCVALKEIDIVIGNCSTRMRGIRDQIIKVNERHHQIL